MPNVEILPGRSSMDEIYERTAVLLVPSIWSEAGHPRTASRFWVVFHGFIRWVLDPFGGFEMVLGLTKSIKEG